MSSYQTMAMSKPNLEPDLKISVASSDDLGHATTWRMKNSISEHNNFSLEEDSEVPIVNEFQHNVRMDDPLPDKLYFLATGKGCATIQLKTIIESFEIQNQNSIYEIALDANQDGSDIYLSMCLRYVIYAFQSCK